MDPFLHDQVGFLQTPVSSLEFCILGKGAGEEMSLSR
jgi:hypothetical protein